jgi:hypothetical protein
MSYENKDLKISKFSILNNEGSLNTKDSWSWIPKSCGEAVAS